MESFIGGFFWFLSFCLHSIIFLQLSPSISVSSDAQFEDNSHTDDCNLHDQVILEEWQTPTSIDNIVMSTLGNSADSISQDNNMSEGVATTPKIEDDDENLKQTQKVSNRNF